MHTSSFQQNVLEELDRELAVTRKVIERIPDDKFDFQPHPKSMKLGQLGSHIVNLLKFKQLFVEANQRDFLDQNAPKPPPSPTTTAELLTRFDQFSEDLRQALRESDDQKLTEGFQLRRGEQVLMDRPKGGALRIMGLNHSIHHRGQLTVYLRLLDIPVPGIYGMSADEMGGF
ncbi:DinB family protein [Hymenobacter ginsengisoli]|uniref:DinB family protein n=1 Tax=Hymenobacter ginsengisoli TaxID=1051626 RepID=A0ABP8Q2S9_9BACT|nr:MULTISPECIES: DinB family protein [unclassified Hymenobacter]MBO2032645.1 DinB family protein [Hymenobacter sp. BT559]